jgi:hypothetical protein
MENSLATTTSNHPVQFDFFNPQQFEVMQRISKLFAYSELVPDMYRVSEKNPIEKAMANCMIAIDMSQRIGASPLMIMQNLVIIYGRPSWSSKFLVATVNTCGRFEPLKYKFINHGKIGKINLTVYVKGQGAKTEVFDGTNIDNIECIAYTTPKGSEDVLESSPVSVLMAIEEGWYTKSGSKWKTMPKKMLMYRAASFWTNEYAPEISMGMKTEEEEHDIQDIDYELIEDRVAAKINNEANKKTVAFNPEPTPDKQPDPEPEPVKEQDKPQENPEQPQKPDVDPNYKPNAESNPGGLFAGNKREKPQGM